MESNYFPNRNYKTDDIKKNTHKTFTYKNPAECINNSQSPFHDE